MRDNSITKVAAVTPSDTDELANPGIGLMIGVGGSIKVVTTGGSTVTLPNLAPGVWHPIAVKQVFSTGTDAAVLADTILVGW